MVKEQLVKLNPWWRTGSVPSELYKQFERDEFATYLDLLKDKRILCITGLRRAGKTNLMYQLINHLLKNEEPKNILYVVFNTKELRDASIKTIIQEYSSLNNINIKKQRVYIFLDEIHYVDDWSFELKDYYDQKYPIKFVISGSSSANLYNVSSESLVGRISIKSLYPFSFREYLSYHNSNLSKIPYFELDNLNQIKKEHKEFFHNKDFIIRLFNQYLLKGAIPEQFEEVSFIKWQNWLRQDYVALTLYKDILEIYGLYDAQALENLLNIIASRSSDKFSYSSLASNLGLKRDSVKQYLLYLKKAFLISEADFYTKSLSKSIRKNKKLYLSDTGLINSMLYRDQLISDEEIGRLVETTVHLHIRRFLSKKFGIEMPLLSYWLDEEEVDIVLKLKNTVLPIEVKYKNKISREDINGLLKFIRKFRSKEGVVITKDLLKKDGNIFYIPAWLFLSGL